MFFRAKEPSAQAKGTNKRAKNKEKTDFSSISWAKEPSLKPKGALFPEKKQKSQLKFKDFLRNSKDLCNFAARNVVLPHFFDKDFNNINNK
ncbi:MAG: hypothetical protein IJ243_00745 [Prevotella sp.]|nr:hypothetical protein [Prevotella sp.]